MCENSSRCTEIKMKMNENIHVTGWVFQCSEIIFAMMKSGFWKKLKSRRVIMCTILSKCSCSVLARRQSRFDSVIRFLNKWDKDTQLKKCVTDSHFTRRDAVDWERAYGAESRESDTASRLDLTRRESSKTTFEDASHDDDKSVLRKILLSSPFLWEYGSKRCTDVTKWTSRDAS